MLHKKNVNLVNFERNSSIYYGIISILHKIYNWNNGCCSMKRIKNLIIKANPSLKNKFIILKKSYIYNVFKSKNCKILYFLSFVLSYLLIPKTVFFRWYILLGLTFMAVFALTLTCIIRTLKEKIFLAKTNGASVLSVVSLILGFSAINVCGIGAPVCGATVGLGVFSMFFPGASHMFFHEYGVFFVVLSIIIQLFSLKFMNCFKAMK